MDNKEKIAELLEKYKNGNITDEEIELLTSLVDIEKFGQFHDNIDKHFIDGDEGAE